MSAPNCPSREESVAYAAGRLPDDTSDRIADHIRGCPTCQAALVTLDDVDDTLIARLRARPPRALSTRSRTATKL